MNSTPEKQIELLRCNVGGLAGTAHIALGWAISQFAEPGPGAAIGLALIVYGIGQKMYAVAVWADILRHKS